MFPTQLYIHIKTFKLHWIGFGSQQIGALGGILRTVTLNSIIKINQLIYITAA